MDEIEWLPSGKPRFKEVKTRKHKCMRTSKHWANCTHPNLFQ
jgi:hypothetical protein